MEGYYSYPRRVSVKELAAKLRVSSSALAELLRKAEQRVVEKYVVEELPHYLVQHVLRETAKAGKPEKRGVGENP
jgi:DNA-binding Lrp family transcriptional regulator